MPELDQSYTPVIVIGAGRSGTNVLRDLLTTIPGFGTWPCDEINYIWRHGNVRHPDDEFPAEFARPEVERFIRRAFGRLARRRDLHHVVEKTCANSLRVGFVDKIFPNARYIHIVRDGRDVVSSADIEWGAPLKVRYLARKARWVPISDLPYYASRYFLNQVHRVTSREKRLATWGPRFPGMDELRRNASMTELLATQWSRCVDRADEVLSGMNPDRVHAIQYERFAADPSGEFEAILDFLGVEKSAELLRRATESVHAGSVGKWKSRLSDADVTGIEQVASRTLARHGYL